MRGACAPRMVLTRGTILSVQHITHNAQHAVECGIKVKDLTNGKELRRDAEIWSCYPAFIRDLCDTLVHRY